jgi:hypothetical protein
VQAQEVGAPSGQECFEVVLGEADTAVFGQPDVFKFRYGNVFFFASYPTIRAS